MELAKKLYTEQGGNLETNLFWSKMKNNSTYKENVLREVKSKIKKGFDAHKEINGQLTKVK